MLTIQNYNPIGSVFLPAKLTLFIFIALLIGCKEELQTTDAGNLVPKTVIENPALPAIAVNGTSLHAETFGNPDSAMIVVIHGGPGGDYRSLLHCKDLADAGYFVVFYDQRGSGLSQRHSKDIYSIQIMIDDLDAVIEHYRSSADQKVFLFGHSWGAMLATAYINAYPDAVNGAVLAEPGGFTWKDTYAYIQRSQKIDLFSESTNDVLFTDQFLTGKEDEHAILDYKLELASAFENSTTSPVGNAGPYPFWRSGAVVQSSLLAIAQKDGFDFTANLHQFATKILFCYSELSPAYGLEHAQLVSAAYPDVQLVKINDSGHEMIYFGWSNMYPIVLNYLNDLK